MTRTYDEHGNLTSVTDADSVTTTYTHHPCGALASITTSAGATTSFDVDLAGLPIRITEPGPAATTVTRDGFGRPTIITNPLGDTTIHHYSAEGKLLSRTDADGTTQSWTYDGEANLLTHTNQIGAHTRYIYGTFDLVSSRETGDGAITTYTYDTERLLTSVTNPLGDTWTYEYDPSGNVNSETDYNGSVTRTEYDLLNRPSTITTPAGVQRRHNYDVLGRFTGVRTDAGEWITNTYTAAGHLAMARNGLDDDTVHSVTFAHSPAGRVLSQHVDGRAVTYEYDEHGRRAKYTTPTGVSTSYEHTSTGQIAALTTNGHRFDFTHDSIGRQNSWHSAGIGQHNTYSPVGYIARRELVQLDPQTSAPMELLERDEYDWRPDGYITRHTTTSPIANRHRDYTLDVIGRITHVAGPSSSATEKYTYDALSNITIAEVTGAPFDPIAPNPPAGDPATDPRFEYRNNLLVRAGRTRYHYDPAGRLIRKEKSRLSRKTATWHYRYNAFDQLIEVTTPDNNTWFYTYDPFGRRTTKQHPESESRTEFTWDGVHLTEQITHTRADRHATSWTKHPGTHIPLTQTIDDRFWAIITNLQGAPTHLANPATGEIESTATTALWGKTTWTGPATDLRFQGQQHDPETGLHYNHHRYYDPETGRYLTQDPLGLAPSSNPNTYPHNSTAWTDPLGLTPCRDEDGAYRFRSPNPDHPTDGRLDDLMNRTYDPMVDCSEIADWMLRRADGEGRIIRYEPAPGSTLETPEAGGRIMEQYVFHEVYTDGRYAYDPRLSQTPIPLGDYQSVMRSLNPGMSWR
ncbi:RHS repeat-associated core domain-containing protein [Nocardia sp. NPDC058480]|uniref:RHS repeat-associated core domain-containing protein n=1 Tax=Nocardia sp. NPDC058480 TaxID=3346522 RepID=UPI00365840F4